MIQYGFQKLVLLGSAGYQRAELPLDDAVSLIAPNNRGKTSLINALQFLLIIDKRRMDFGAHDVDKSRRFYFPTNSAYILLEVSLPSVGTLVLGCVGKGVSHDYEYFYYKGPLVVDDYRQTDGNLVAQPNLVSHLAQQGRLVSMCSQAEFKEVVFGGRRVKGRAQSDFSIFQLEHVSDAEAFQQVLTRTLRLDKLSSANVKEYLLQIFDRDLPDSKIDFKQEWDKAFADVDADRIQYQAAKKSFSIIQKLETQFEERLKLRGKLLNWRPRIDQGLQEWERHYQERRSNLKVQKTAALSERDALGQRDIQLAKRETVIEQTRNALQKENERADQLEREFSLIVDRTVLDQQLIAAQQKRDEQITLIGQTGSRSIKAIEQELLGKQRTLKQLERERETLEDNLFLRLKSELSDAEMNRLNRVLAQDVMVSDPSAFELTSTTLAAFLQNQGLESFSIPGLSLKLNKLGAQHQQKTQSEIDETLCDTMESIESLERQLDTARSLEQAKERQRALEKEVRECEASLARFAELQRLKSEALNRESQLTALLDEQAQISITLKQSKSQRQQFEQEIRDIESNEQSLEQAHSSIDQNRNRRIDSDSPFTNLESLDHYPWLAEPDWSLDVLPIKLGDYMSDCKMLRELDYQLDNIRSNLHAEGLTKFQYSETGDRELRSIIDFSRNLIQEEEALEKKARSAVVSVTTSLKELRGGLHAFQSRMREFNRLIGHRQLSDLKTFKIEAEPEPHLVEAIDVLISTASQVDTGDSFELFNQASVLDDEKLTRAKQILIDEGNARHGLRVADLFRLMFIVAKSDQSDERFEDIDSAASNGTVLMAKLVTGLAMLHLMQDKRHNVRGICYLDEALALDGKNQSSLIETAKEFGFALIFASPAPLTTVRYCVPIHHHQGKNHISRESWQILEPLGENL